MTENAGAGCPGVVATHLWSPDDEVVRVETHWVGAEPVSVVIMGSPADRNGGLTHTCLIPLAAEQVALAIARHVILLELLGEPLIADTCVPGDDPDRRLGTARNPSGDIITTPTSPIPGIGVRVRRDRAPGAVFRQHCRALRDHAPDLAAAWPLGEPE